MMFRYLALLGIILAMSAARAEDWPRFRGPDDNCISKEKGLLQSWPSGDPKILWSAKLGLGFSSMAISQGRVYTMYQESERSGDQFVTCLDEKTGKPLWPAPVKTGPFFYDSRDYYHGPRSTPTVEKDRVYALDANGIAVCLNAADGKLIWSKDILALTGGANNKWGMAQSPYIYGDMVLFISGGSCSNLFIALNKLTGETVWKCNEGGIGAYTTPVISKAGGVEHLVWVAGDQMVGLNPKDGKILWKYPWESTNDLNAVSPLAWDDKAFVSGGYYHAGEAVKIDMSKSTATRLWQNRSLTCYMQQPILLDGHIYGFDMQIAACVDVNGNTKWREGDLPAQSQMVYADGLFYIWHQSGTFTLARLTPSGAQILGSMDVASGSHSWSIPALANGRLYVRSYDTQQVYCIDVKAK